MTLQQSKPIVDNMLSTVAKEIAAPVLELHAR